jgi:hypothetical protein
MRITKQQLRDAAWEAVHKRGYAPELVSGPGIVSGARLRATAGPIAGKQIAVRTSQDREVGLLRRDDKEKKWRTIPKVRELVVAVPSLTNPDSLIEVLGFDSKTVIAQFDAAVEKAGSRTLSYKAPVFMALEDPQKGSGALAGGLGAKAEWRNIISVESIAAKLPDQSDGFVERVKREFAELNGVDVTKVVVEFRIVA